jgi:preprotein translocase subunit SecD
MKNIIQFFILLLFIGASNSSAIGGISIRYALCQNNIENIEVVPQGNLYSLRIALTESATEEFYRLTKDNIGKTLDIVFEDALVSGADIDAPISSGLILTIPATKEGANRLRQSILDDIIKPHVAK